MHGTDVADTRSKAAPYRTEPGPTVSREASRPVDPVDAMWLEMDRPNNLMVITSVIFLASPPDWDAVERLIEERVVARYPVFRQVPVHGSFGHISWTDDEHFDLTRHVHRVQLAPPGGDSALQAFIAERAVQPFDRAHPLWEVHLVEDGGASAALVYRSHHSLADGLALARVLLSLTEDADGGVTLDALDAGIDESAQHDGGPGWPLSLVASAVSSGVATTVQLGRLGWRAGQALARPESVADAAGLAWRTAQVATTLLLQSNPPSPLAGEPAVAKLVVWSRPRPLTGLKSVGRLSGATLNDVLMSAAAAALHTYQLEHDAAPVDLVTMVPVNLRPVDRPLPRTLGNEFALVLLTLPSAVGAPLARLAETKRRMDWIKASPEPTLTYLLTNVIGRLGRDLGRPLVDFFADKAIGVTTNVRGPDTIRYLAGTPVTGVLGWVPGSGRQTLGICIFTYAGHVQVGFMSDRSVIPDPTRLLVAFEDELDLLLHLGDSGLRGDASGPRGGSRHAH